MMDTLAVALRVAEEAIEEAISKAEAHGDSLVGLPCSLGGGWGEGPCYQEVVQVRWEVGDPTAFARAVSDPLCTCGQDSSKTVMPHPLNSLPLQDKQNEASYLRDHKEELTEELATTILQKVGVPGNPGGCSPPGRQPQGPGELKSELGAVTGEQGEQGAHSGS